MDNVELRYYHNPARSRLEMSLQDLGALVSREPRERPSSMHPDVVLALQGQDVNRNAVSRQGGSRANPRALPTRLVVDVREFMSSLPAVLYQQGLDLVPLTLEVSPSENEPPPPRGGNERTPKGGGASDAEPQPGAPCPRGESFRT